MRLEFDRSEVEHPGGIEIGIKGFKHHPYESDECVSQVYIEVIGGQLKVLVWDGTTEDPTQTVIIDPLVAEQPSSPETVAA